MSSVKQVIPSFVQGMTDQPDELKIPGQVRSVTDALPDVTLGLIKRPGYKHLSTLSNSDYQGKWFNIFAENSVGFEEQYICNISTEGVVRVWAAIDIVNAAGTVVATAGQEIPTSQPEATPLSLTDNVLFSAAPAATSAIEYFKHNKKAQLQTLNIGATTLVTNRQAIPTMSGDGISLENHPYEGYIELKQIAYGRDYALDIQGDGGTTVEIVSAQDLNISPGSFSKNENRCQGAGADTFTNVDDPNGTGTGLSYRITVTCRIAPSDSNDSPGDSVYTVEIDTYSGGRGWAVGDEFNITYRTYPYTIKVTSVTRRVVQDALAVISYASPSTGEGPALKATTILAELETQLKEAKRPDNNEAVFTEVTIIGNGIYVKSDREFTIATPEEELFNIFSSTTELSESGDVVSRYSSVNNVGDLPQQCKHGVIVKVANTFNDADDYYVRFQGNDDADGPGVWEETFKPGIKTVFNGETMPHLIRRTLDADGNLIFAVSEVKWIRRTVGDDQTNPVPSFVDLDGTTFPTINGMLLYRNRLVFLSSNNVILSQSGDLGNWFGDTALTIKSSDPIDINASVDTSTALYAGLVVNNGMVLFSKFNQFLFTTDSDILSPQTAKSSLLGTYDFNPNSNPFNMASNVGFFSSAGNDSIFWEMRDIFREGPPNVEERSKPVQRSLPSDLDLIVASREDGLILASSRYYNEVWGYRFFSQGDRQLQSAWFRWTVPGELLFHFNNTRGKYWIVYRDSNGVVQLMNMDLKEKLRSTSLEGVPYEYYVYLDNWTEVLTQPNAAKRRTEFTLPYTPDRDVYVYTLNEGEFRGASAKAEYDDEVDVWWVPGTWTGTLAAGYKFEMEVKFPHFYVTSREGQSFRSDTTGSLTLHRLKVNFSTVGMFTFELDRYGKDKYTMTTETTEMDGYDADRVAGYPDKQYTIPVYDKAVNSLLTMKSDHPTPATLLSLTMEGDYTTNYYKSV